MHIIRVHGIIRRIDDRSIGILFSPAALRVQHRFTIGVAIQIQFVTDHADGDRQVRHLQGIPKTFHKVPEIPIIIAGLDLIVGIAFTLHPGGGIPFIIQIGRIQRLFGRADLCNELIKYLRSALDRKSPIICQIAAGDSVFKDRDGIHMLQ